MAPLRRLALSVLFTITTTSYQTTCTVSERTSIKGTCQCKPTQCRLLALRHYQSRFPIFCAMTFRIDMNCSTSSWSPLGGVIIFQYVPFFLSMDSGSDNDNPRERVCVIFHYVPFSFHVRIHAVTMIIQWENKRMELYVFCKNRHTPARKLAFRSFPALWPIVFNWLAD